MSFYLSILLLLQMIEPIADILDIPIHRVYANNLLFDASNGKFAGFDPKELTSRDGGKPAVLKKLIDAHGYGPVGKMRVFICLSFRALQLLLVARQSSALHYVHLWLCSS